MFSTSKHSSGQCGMQEMWPLTCPAHWCMRKRGQWPRTWCPCTLFLTLMLLGWRWRVYPEQCGRGEKNLTHTPPSFAQITFLNKLPFTICFPIRVFVCPGHTSPQAHKLINTNNTANSLSLRHPEL